MDQSIAQKFNMLRAKMFHWLELALPATSLQYSLLGVHLEILDLRMPKRLPNGPRSKKHNRRLARQPSGLFWFLRGERWNLGLIFMFILINSPEEFKFKRPTLYLCPGVEGTPGCAARLSKSWPYYRLKMSFPHLVSDLASKIHIRFQTEKQTRYTCMFR